MRAWHVTAVLWDREFTGFLDREGYDVENAVDEDAASEQVEARLPEHWVIYEVEETTPPCPAPYCVFAKGHDGPHDVRADRWGTSRCSFPEVEHPGFPCNHPPFDPTA